MIDFDKNIVIKCWNTENVLAKVGATQGMKMMGCSHRFDSNHCTAAVRTLDAPHADMVNVTIEHPVTFEQ